MEAILANFQAKMDDLRGQMELKMAILRPVWVLASHGWSEKRFLTMGTGDSKMADSEGQNGGASVPACISAVSSDIVEEERDVLAEEAEEGAFWGEAAIDR